MARLMGVRLRTAGIATTLVAILALTAPGCFQAETRERPVAATPGVTGGGDHGSTAPAKETPEAEPPAKANTNVFDAEEAKVGDEVLGMKITRIEVDRINETDYAARVGFSGQATVSGTYTHEKKDEEMLGCQIRFEVDEESARSLPKEKRDTRVTWFVFTDHDEAEKLLGPPGTTGRATVVIDRYGINLTYSCEYNIARLLKLVEKE